jgi:hypothetical protein
MGKRLIRLTESDLHRIVKEAVNRILREDGEAAMGDGGGIALNFGGESSYEPGGSTTTTTVPRGQKGDQTFGVSYPYNGKGKDPSYTRPRGDIAMNKNEKPVGHKG